MFQITRFVMEDFVDSLDQLIYIVSFNKRYMVYNASRRRLVYSEMQFMDAGQSPLDLITTGNLAGGLVPHAIVSRVRGSSHLVL